MLLRSMIIPFGDFSSVGLTDFFPNRNGLRMRCELENVNPILNLVRR